MANGLRVWASGPFSPVVICPDARTPDPGGKGYPEGSDVGQFGWDIGMTFSSLDDLAGKLQTATSEHGGDKVERLAICVHGLPGYVDIDGKVGSGSLSVLKPNLSYEEQDNIIKTRMFGSETFNAYKPKFEKIKPHLTSNATLLFMSCNMGAGSLGANILQRLSGEVFRGVKVVGFIRVGISGQMAVKSCMLPGMKTIDSTDQSHSPEQEHQRWLAVQGDPWASEKSSTAKVALNGELTKDPDPPPPATDYSPDAYLPGTWSVTIGDWRGYFLFGKAHDASWQDEVPTKRHPGKWWARDGSVYWSFDDDPPGWQRIFEVAGALKSTVQGNATIKGVPHGFFTMSKQY